MMLLKRGLVCAVMVFALASMPALATWEIVTKQVWNGTVNGSDYKAIPVSAQYGDVISTRLTSSTWVDVYILTSYQYQDYLNMISETGVGFSKSIGAYAENVKSVYLQIQASLDDTYYILIDNTNYTGGDSRGDARISCGVDVYRSITTTYQSSSGGETQVQNNTYIIQQHNLIIYSLLGATMAMILLTDMYILYQFKKLRRLLIKLSAKKKTPKRG